MATKSKDIVYVEISELDYLIIKNIREIRMSKGLTQLQLSQRIKLADGFVSKVETLTERAKYSIRHLSLIAKVLDVPVKELVPSETPIHDLVILTFKKVHKIKKDGSISLKKDLQLIDIQPIRKK